MYEILTYLLNQGYENVDLIDGKPARYITLDEAQQELQEFLLDTLDAYNRGDLENEYKPSDYLIKNSSTYETYHISWNSSKTGINLVSPAEFIKAS